MRKPKAPVKPPKSAAGYSEMETKTYVTETRAQAEARRKKPMTPEEFKRSRGEKA